MVEAMLYLCVTLERPEKTRRIMNAMAEGWGEEVRVIEEALPPDDGNPVMLWGQRFLAQRLLPRCVASGRPYWHIDNGYWDPARGTATGFYRVTYRSLGPVLLPDPRPRYGQEVVSRIKPWRANGEYVLLAFPGDYYGCSVGLNMRSWNQTILRRLRAATHRPIRVRDKPSARKSSRPLDRDLSEAWALVTHSSNVAVDAVLAGVPVFVERGSPAEPVGSIGLDIERPAMPDREQWLASLSWQQFTLDEMRDGTAYRCLMAVKEQADDVELRSYASNIKGPGALPSRRHGHECTAHQ